MNRIVAIIASAGLAISMSACGSGSSSEPSALTPSQLKEIDEVTIDYAWDQFSPVEQKAMCGLYKENPTQAWESFSRNNKTTGHASFTEHYDDVCGVGVRSQPGVSSLDAATQVSRLKATFNALSASDREAICWGYRNDPETGWENFSASRTGIDHDVYMTFLDSVC